MKKTHALPLYRAVAVIALASAVLTGCGKQSANETKADTTSAKKILRFGQGNAGTGYDMQRSTSSLAASVADEVTESLLRFDDDNIEQPWLITDFPSVSDDGLTYSFELKKGVHFTNGAELTSDDVKYTFERMFTPKTGAKSTAYFTMIKGAKDMLAGKATSLEGFTISDNYHFTITLDYPYAPFVKNIGTSYADIFPREACEAAGDTWGTGTNLIGTGPYKIVENDDTTRIVLVKNTDYHGGPVNLDELDIIFFSSDQTKLIAYENGDIDLCDLSAALLSQYQATYPDQITAYHPLGTAFISLNLKSEYIKDAKIRQAISLAINRKELVDAVLNGAGIPASSYLNNNIPGHDASLSVYEYNPEKAKQLLAEAGYPNGITVTSQVRQSSAAVYEALQGYLQDAGIHLDLTSVDNATWNSNRTAGKIPATDMIWNALYPDGDFQMYNYFYSSNSNARGVFYKNAEFDSLLDKARASTNEDERAELYKKADSLLSLEDYACIPLYYPQNQFIAKPWVKNYKVGNLIYHFWNVDIDTSKK
ncbi:MAG: ABC transporter substrate-binding protein [Treponema sp.]|nr:ABC transporter substrate-binding protein [Treponema sp.]